MGWSIFIEEPGAHQRSLPYGALVGIAVEDRLVWQLARKLKDAEIHFFGGRLENLSSHLTVDSMLSTEAVRIANGWPDLPPSTRASLTRRYLDEEDTQPSLEQLVAFAQSQVAFCRYALELLQAFETKSFAVLAPSEHSELAYASCIRKDYAFFFERLTRFLSGQGASAMGTLVVNPQRHTEDFVPIASITAYFEKTTKGRLRSKFLIPEPLMANSCLRVINQTAVIISHVLSWGFRLPGMTHPRRSDLDELVRRCNQLRVCLGAGSGKKDWSFIFLNDLRPRHDIEQPVTLS